MTVGGGKDRFGSKLGEHTSAGGWTKRWLQDFERCGKDRAGAKRIGGAKKTKGGHAKNVSKVHAASVVGYQEAAKPEFLHVGG